MVLVSPREVGLLHRLAVVVRGLSRAVLISLDAPPRHGAQVGVVRMPAIRRPVAPVWFGPDLSAAEVVTLVDWLRDGGPPHDLPAALGTKVVHHFEH